MLCVYCGREVSAGTREHVLPSALGGNIEPVNPFIIRVCDRCNNYCGTFVDGPFIKDWFTRADRAAIGRKFIDLSRSPALPLMYFGKENDVNSPDGRVCDFWTGPTGDHVYHFHFDQPSTTRWDQRDPGFVFLFVVATNPAWHRTILESAVAQFPGATFYLGNGPRPAFRGFEEVPEDRLALRETLRLLPAAHPLSMTIDLAAGDRFLAKLGLGFGALFLAENFLVSGDADLLRKFLWTADPQVREQIPLLGLSFLANRRPPVDLSIEGAHIFTLIPRTSGLELDVNIYRRWAGILVTKQSSHWKDHIPDDGGSIFVVVPGLRRSVGPIALGEYITWKLRALPNRELDSLKHEMDQFSELPPYHLAGPEA